MLPEKLLLEFGANEKRVAKDEVLFSIGQRATYYYQVKSGKIKMNNYNDDGREFIQGIFSKGQSFGEPPLFGDWEYPANAVAVSNSVVLRLSKDHFLDMLRHNHEAHLSVTRAIAERLHYKATIAAEMSTNSPEHRILALLKYMKKYVYMLDEPQTFEVDLTRQQIGDLCGLRVETTIKAIKKLELNGKLRIVNRKVVI